MQSPSTVHEGVSQDARNSEATSAQPSRSDNSSYSMITPTETETKSPFLRLPGEIRNIIYEYALTDEELHYARGSREYLASRERLARLGLVSTGGMKGRWDNVARLWGTRGDPNPLKYVCRQLYTESAGLEFKFNRLVISKAKNPARSFASFLRHGNLPNASWLTTVILRSQYGALIFGEIECTEGLILVAKFCKDNPRVTVKYFDPFWSYAIVCPRTYDTASAALFMSIGINMTEAIRAMDLSFLFPQEQRYILREIDRRRNPRMSPGARKLPEPLTPNFRIYSQSLRNTDGFRGHLEIDMNRWGMEEEMKQLWRDMIEFWVEEGA